MLRIFAALVTICGTNFALGQQEYCAVTAVNEGQPFGWTDFWATTKALQNALGFFEVDSARANVDALIGTRIAEGQMKVLYAHLKETTRAVSSKTLRRAAAVTRKLLKKLGEIADKILSAVSTSEPEYLAAMLPVVQENTWDKLDYPVQEFMSQVDSFVDVTLPIEVDESADTFKEKESDMCLKEVVGTSLHGAGKKCKISKQCWAFMTSPDRSGYSLTHEVLYLQVGEMFGCERQMRRLAKKTYNKDLNELKQGFCAAVYREVLSEAQHCFPQHLRDLFMEQVTLCGIYGFRSFFRSEWLEKIISWQKPNGCFAFHYPNTSNYDFKMLNQNSVDYVHPQEQLPTAHGEDEEGTNRNMFQEQQPTDTHQEQPNNFLPEPETNLNDILQNFRQQFEYKPVVPQETHRDELDTNNAVAHPNQPEPSSGSSATNTGISADTAKTYGVRVYTPEDRRAFRESMRSRLGLEDKVNATLTQLTHIVSNKDRRASSTLASWRRVKREETLMDGGCLSHATALGVDSLSLHLRFILDDIYANNLMK